MRRFASGERSLAACIARQAIAKQSADRDASMISQMKAMEDENRRLKRMYADLSMQADLLKEALGKK